MITKELLSQLRDLAAEADELRGLIRAFRYGLDSPFTDGTPRGTETSDPTGVKAVRKASLEALWQEKIEKIESIGTEFERELSRLDAPTRRIMRMYYFQGLNDRRIGDLTNYAREVVCRKRAAAVKTITKGGV